MKKKYLILISLIILLSVSLVYAQQQFNTWIGWPFVNGVVAPNNTQITAYSQEDNSVVSNNAVYPTTSHSIFMMPVETGENDSVYFKINGMIADQEPQKMNVDNGNDCSSLGITCNANVHYLDITVTDNDNDKFAKGFEGYTGTGRDCNDNNPNINPNTTETCNAMDDNCNNIVDDGFDKDGDGFFPNTCTGYKVYDTDDNDNLTYPGAGEVCDGKDNDNNGIIDSFTQSCYTGPEGTEGVSFCHGGTRTCTAGSFTACIGEVTPLSDTPGDDIDQDCDGADDKKITGDITNVKAEGFSSTPNITIGGSSNLTEDFIGEQEVLILDGNETVIKYQHNFSESTLDLTNVSINVSDVGGKGAIIITGLTLQSGEKKEVLIDKLASAGKVCIKDAEGLASVSELATSSCTGVDEHLIPCNGVKSGDYTCTDIGDKYKIEGLTHSGIIENTYTAPASSSGGGGGGGGGGGKKATATAPSTTTEAKPAGTKAVETTPEAAETTTTGTTPEAAETTDTGTGGGLGGITGAVTGALGKNKGVTVIIFLVVVAATLIVLNFWRSKRKLGAGEDSNSKEIKF